MHNFRTPPHERWFKAKWPRDPHYRLCVPCCRNLPGPAGGLKFRSPVKAFKFLEGVSLTVPYLCSFLYVVRLCSYLVPIHLDLPDRGAAEFRPLSGVQPAFRYLFEISRLARRKNKHLHAHRVDDPRYINRLGASSAGCTRNRLLFLCLQISRGRGGTRAAARSCPTTRAILSQRIAVGGVECIGTIKIKITEPLFIIKIVASMDLLIT
jgi:hypothetical protein